MKRILKSVLSILAIGVLIYSCSQEEQINLESENLNNLEKLSNRITLTETTSKVSNLFFNLGISKVDVTKENDVKNISLTSEKQFSFRGNSTNLSNYSVKVNDKIITLNEDNRYKIGIKNEKAYIITPDFSGFYDEANLSVKQNVKTFVLLGFLNELVYDKEKLDISKISNLALRGGCSFWDTYYSVGVGITPTTAKADLQASMEDDISEGETEGCTKIGGPGAVSFTNETVYVQAWCCP